MRRGSMDHGGPAERHRLGGMAAVDITNSVAEWLVVWLEPYGRDYWLKPGERVRVQNTYSGDEAAFELDFWAEAADRAAGIENVNCCVNEGYDTVVVNPDGIPLDCGYQRPDHVDARWQAAFDRIPMTGRKSDQTGEAD
jgi:hypothetical protein